MIAIGEQNNGSINNTNQQQYRVISGCNWPCEDYHDNCTKVNLDTDNSLCGFNFDTRNSNYYSDSISSDSISSDSIYYDQPKTSYSNIRSKYNYRR
jgi:hypothetical protein